MDRRRTRHYALVCIPVLASQGQFWNLVAGFCFPTDETLQPYGTHLNLLATPPSTLLFIQLHLMKETRETV